MTTIIIINCDDDGNEILYPNFEDEWSAADTLLMRIAIKIN